MKRVRNLFKQTEFHFFLFFLGIGMFSWPFMKILHSEQPQTTFFRVFSVWAAMIAVLFLINRYCNESDSTENQNKNAEDSIIHKDHQCLIRE